MVYDAREQVNERAFANVNCAQNEERKRFWGKLNLSFCKFVLKLQKWKIQLNTIVIFVFYCSKMLYKAKKFEKRLKGLGLSRKTFNQPEIITRSNPH